MKKLIILFATVIIFTLLSPHSVLAMYDCNSTIYTRNSMTWLTDYSYRKEITITGSTAGQQTNYQLCLTVHYGSGVDSGADVYLNSHCQADFDDIRFTKSDEETLLDYWVESYTASTTATVWIEFDSIPASPNTATFYIYYGDGDAVSGSTTSIWTIFNSGGTLTGWTLKNNVGGAGSVGVAVSSGHLRMTANANDSCGHFLCDTQTGINSYKFYASIQAQDGLTASNYQQGLVHKVTQSTNDNGHGRWIEAINKWQLSDEAGGSADSSVDNSFNASNQHSYLLTRYNDISRLYVDDSLKVSLTKASWNPQYIGFHGYFASTGHWFEFWNIFVGKYVDPEPTFTDWGEEEEPILLPDGETSEATLVTTDSARLNAYISDDGGEACDVRFQYYYGGGSWTDNETAWVGGYVTDDEPYVDIDSLVENEVYYCRVQIKNSAGTFSGESVDFTTLSSCDLPEGETRYATFITEDSARLNAYISDDGGEACEVRFQYYYGEGTWTDNETSWVAGYLTGEEPYVDIDTLVENEVYYCRVQIKNGAGTFDGQSVAFTPYNAPTMPSRWFGTPDVERFHNSFFYGMYNFIADRIDMPRDVFYMLATLFWCIVIFAVILVIGRRLVPAIYGVSGSMAIASLITLLPMFFIGFSVIGFLGAIKMGHPREE